MIHYALVCEKQHKFDGWFASAAAYEDQKGRGLVSCPVCASTTVDKAIMAPAVRNSAPEPARQVAAHGMPPHIRQALMELRQKVVAEADYVGDRFAEEARKIHYNETDPRGIYGEATRDEIVALVDEGVEIMPLPNLPDEQN